MAIKYVTKDEEHEDMEVVSSVTYKVRYTHKPTLRPLVMTQESGVSSAAAGRSGSAAAGGRVDDPGQFSSCLSQCPEAAGVV